MTLQQGDAQSRGAPATATKLGADVAGEVVENAPDVVLGDGADGVVHRTANRVRHRRFVRRLRRVTAVGRAGLGEGVTASAATYDAAVLAAAEVIKRLAGAHSQCALKIAHRQRLHLSAGH